MKSVYLFSLQLLSGFVITLASTGVVLADAAEAIECPDKPAAAVNPYKGVYYANDFSYLDDPCLEERDGRDALSRAGDRLKRMRLGPNVVIDIGGEHRLRFHDENNHGRTRLAGLDNDFLLSRLRLYMNAEAGKHFRFYVEGLDAASVGEELPPRGIEVDRWDFLNLFGEFRYGGKDGQVSVRVGRQELLFGGQRLISPLNWGNTRRTFDGVRLDYKAKGLTVSGFMVNPRQRRPNRLDGTNGSLTFTGLYASYTGWAKQTLDVYGLRLEETSPNVVNFDIFTAGSRIKGGRGNLMWEGEAAYQWGDHGVLTQKAAMVSLSLGYKLGGMLPLKPVVWAFFDLASGDGDGSNGARGTFHQHFPLGHAYFGFIDLVGRQNIRDLAFRVITKPFSKVTFIVTGHSFDLATRNDGLYNAGGGRIRFDPTGAAGKDVGEELDLVVKVALLQRAGLLVGYSRFWGGKFIAATNPPGVSGDVDFFYTQLTYSF